MFESLSDKLSSVFKTLRGRGKLNEADVEAAMREVRMALLEADVNYKVVKDFVGSVRERSLGQEVAKSLTPGQTVIKIVREEMVRVMGEGHEPLDLRAAPPVVIMLVGLQGSGKTTTAGKLALYLKKQLKRDPYLVPVDVYRPAAIQQLKKLGADLKVPVYDSNPAENPVEIARKAFEAARQGGYDTVILDTAGRLHIDEELMDELKKLSAALAPREILFVADAMTGQDAVNVAKEFDSALGITGVVLTKLDGDARGGAALSIRAVTGKPVKFVGVGEKAEAIEPFHPEGMASRILGMGDVLSIIEKAGSVMEAGDVAAMEEKLLKNTFTLVDFRDQLMMVEKMGGVEEVLGKLPGMGKAMGNVKADSKDLKKTIAIINSMTPGERKRPDSINPSRKKRIAKGSGTRVEDVNRLLNRFREAQTMMKKMGGLLKGGGKMAKLLGKGLGKLPFPMK
jgi:signal recognition particle subunit SRP54